MEAHEIMERLGIETQGQFIEWKIEIVKAFEKGVYKWGKRWVAQTPEMVDSLLILGQLLALLKLEGCYDTSFNYLWEAFCRLDYSADEAEIELWHWLDNFTKNRDDYEIFISRIPEPETEDYVHSSEIAEGLIHIWEEKGAREEKEWLRFNSEK